MREMLVKSEGKPKSEIRYLSIKGSDTNYGLYARLDLSLNLTSRGKLKLPLNTLLPLSSVGYSIHSRECSLYLPRGPSDSF